MWRTRVLDSLCGTATAAAHLPGRLELDPRDTRYLGRQSSVEALEASAAFRRLVRLARSGQLVRSTPVEKAMWFVGVLYRSFDVHDRGG